MFAPPPAAWDTHAVPLEVKTFPELPTHDKPVPPRATGSVPVLIVDTLTPPPSVIVPELVIGPPVRVTQLIVPEVATLVTEPPPVPAPIAVRKQGAESAETVLSAFTLRNVIAEGLARVNKFPPTVVAPRLVRAPLAVEDPVPPSATARSVPNVNEER
ncbi:MAG: hypothetical protein EBQ92_13380 [Proteobacteria bacterium]|nr:hypothetical protein [Pseudomonadota bacterium]